MRIAPDLPIPCPVDDPRLAALAPLPPMANGGQGLLGEEARLVYWLWEEGTALIGALEARTEEAGESLLLAARESLSRAGARRILGPMNGSTWFEYRLPLRDDSSGEPPFTGEPEERPDLVRCWERAGFHVTARYESRVADLPARRPGADLLARRIEREGIEVGPASGEPRQVLERLFRFSADAFQDNPFYRPVSFAEFAAAQGGRSTPTPLVLLAEWRGELLGFVYAYGDAIRPERLVLKTLATAPGARSRGLGAHLADRLHGMAARHGFRQVIHALMYEENASLRHSHRFGSRLLRRYGLFEWRPE